MKSDNAIKSYVDHTDIAVKINQGVATLTGFVSSYAQKYRAGNAAKRVGGVAALATA